jgi:hypothetical protein
MIKYDVTLKTTDKNFTTRVEIADTGEPVQNNGTAIRAAMAEAARQAFTVIEPLRVERI